MPRVARQAPGGLWYHVINRGVGRMTLFEKATDFDAFEAVLEETHTQRPMRVGGYCAMPNHWHFVLWPQRHGDLAAFMQRLTITHVRRWQEHRHVVGEGHVYQGRFKSFPIEADEHLLAVLRYVERNALRAGLVERAESWRWGSLWRRRSGAMAQRALLFDIPIDLPRNWVQRVNRPETEAELESLRRCVRRGQPYGGDRWTKRMTKRLGLESTFRPRGRPRNIP